MEEVENVKRNRALFNIKVMPYFMGFSDDLMFYIAIGTLFLTTVKNFTASQISFLMTIGYLSYILLQRPFLSLIKKIGNAASVRVGVIFLLLSAIIITFGKSYWFIMVGEILYMTAYLFKSMDNVMLKDNLTYLNKKDDYIKYKNKATIVYSIVTAVLALFSGYLFNINYFLPMYFCIVICLINVFISFNLTDENQDLSKEDTLNSTNKKKINFSKIILTIMLSYGIFYATISTGQTNVKLLIQYQLENYFDIGLTATYFSYILVMSRISRIVSNVGFYKIYNKVKDKIGYVLPILGIVAFSLVIVGNFTSQVLIKFVLMGIGLCIILGIRDVFNIYMQDLLLKNLKQSDQQAGISYLGLSRKIGETSISFMFSLMLLKVELLYVIVSLVILAIVSLLINLKLYKMVTKSNEV